MHGFQHKRMGVAAGAGILVFTILAKAPPELALCMATVPIGAMLPDIDHDSSKIGRTRKTAVTAIKVGCVLVVTGFVITSYIAGGIWNAILNAGYIGGMALLINIIECNKHVKKQLGFITKHRGIMHTLIPPAFLMGTTFWTSDLYYDYAMIGIVVGYIVHLWGDMATEEGAPILWPLTKKNIRYFSLNTNRHKTAIEVVCNIWCAVFIGIGIYFGVKGGL